MATKAPPAKEAPKPAEKTAQKEPPKDDKAKGPAANKDDGKTPASKDPPKDDKNKAPAPGKDDGKAPASKDPPKDDKTKAPAAAAGKDTTAAAKDKNGAPPVQGQTNPENRASVSNADAKQMGNFFDALDNPDQEAKHEDEEDDDIANLHPVPTDDPKEIQKRKNQADMFKKYLDNTGVSMAFQIIYAEILAKKITTENVFSYTAMRLRQIGSDLAAISVNKQKK